MKRFATLTAVIALASGMAFAQDAATEVFTPGADFMLNWDLDGDGQVTLAEATERRESIFYMFDLDGDGSYSPEELVGIDEHKALQAELGMGVGRGQTGKARDQMLFNPQAQGQLAPRGGRGGRGHGQAMQQPGIAGPGAYAQQPGVAGQVPGMLPNQPGVAGRGAFAQQPGVAGQVPGVAGQQPGVAGQGPGALAQGQQPGVAGQPQLRQPGMQGQAGAGRGRGANLTDLATIGTAQEILMFDADFDGVITMTEFLNGTPAWFAQRDRNVDGVITSADFGNGRF